MTYAVEPVVKPMAAVRGAVIPPHDPVTVPHTRVSLAVCREFTVVNSVLLVIYATSLFKNRSRRDTSDYNTDIKKNYNFSPHYLHFAFVPSTHPGGRTNV